MDRIGKLTLNSRLLSGHLGFVTGTLRGSLFPVCYGSVGVQLTRLRKLNQGTLTSKCVQKKLNATVLQVTSTRESFKNSCTGIRRRGKTCQYSSSSTNILYLNILYIVVGVGKVYGRHRGHREQYHKKAPDSAGVWRMSRLTRDGTAKSVSRNQILRRERERGTFSLFS